MQSQGWCEIILVGEGGIYVKIADSIRLIFQVKVTNICLKTYITK